LHIFSIDFFLDIVYNEYAMNLNEKLNGYKELIYKNEKIKEFKNLLFYYNKKFNLTSITDENEIFYKHFVDSLAGEFLFKEGANVCEVGSGAGFPSIVLKIIRDDLSFTLIESTGKKCAFLKEVINNLSLKNMEVLNVRAEEASKNPVYRQKFDCVTARAVARMNSLSEYCIPFIKVGGNFIAYKGDCGEELKGSENAIKILGGKIREVYNYDLFSYGKRTLIDIVKIKDTPEKYPRGNGKERSKPL